jgi:hypothetical protein
MAVRGRTGRGGYPDIVVADNFSRRTKCCSGPAGSAYLSSTKYRSEDRSEICAGIMPDQL